MSTCAVQLDKLTKQYPHSAKRAVSSLTFEIQEGSVFGLLGPNGAGKTTTIQMLLGILTPTSGSIHYFGKSLATHRTQIMRKVCYASAYVKMPARLSIRANLEVFARLYGVDSRERSKRIDHYLHVFKLWDFRYREIAMLSAGQLARVNLNKAFIPNPQILLLS
jgi:ABC-2 type transport system ATP-binding protein